MEVGDEDQRRRRQSDHRVASGGSDLARARPRRRTDWRGRAGRRAPTASDSSAEKNSRPSKPIIAADQRSRSRSTAARRTDRRRASAAAAWSMSSGASASVDRDGDEQADLHRDLAFDTPGASIRQPPMRQNSTNVASMSVRAEVAPAPRDMSPLASIKTSTPKRLDLERRARSRAATAPAGSGTCAR